MSVSYGRTSSVSRTPASSNGGRPYGNSSSMTHWMNVSATTGQRSIEAVLGRAGTSGPLAWSAGVMRSTMPLGKATLRADPGLEAGLHHGADAQRGRPRRRPVAHDVVAAEHREAAQAAHRAGPQGRAPGASKAGGSVGRREEGTRGLVDGVATLGDRQRHDARLRLGQSLDERVRGPGWPARSPRAEPMTRTFVPWLVARDERVQTVLGPQGARPWPRRRAARPRP